MSYNKSSINSIYLIHPPQPAKGDGQKNNSKKQKNDGALRISLIVQMKLS